MRMVQSIPTWARKPHCALNEGAETHVYLCLCWRRQWPVVVPPWEFKGSCCSLIARLTSLETALSPCESLGNRRNEINECNSCLLQPVRDDPGDLLQLCNPCNCLGCWRKQATIEHPCPHLHQNEFGINFERTPVFNSYIFCTSLNISYW